MRTTPHPPPWLVHDGVLTGLKILDLSRILSGPFCTMMLADLGADVIKVEDTVSGDDTRAWGPPSRARTRRTSTASTATSGASPSTSRTPTACA